MVTVLVTGASGVGGSATVRTLQDRTEHDVVAVDMNPTAAALSMADQMRSVPPADSDRWVSEMVTVIAEFDVDAVIPLLEEELVRLPELKSAVADDVVFVAPRKEVIEKTTDKYAFSRLSVDGLNVPNTYLATAAADIPPTEFPAVAKPRYGRGSTGMIRLEDRNDMWNHLASIDRDPQEVIVQEYVEGTEYTTSIVATSDDELLAIVPKQVIEKQANTHRGVTRNKSAIHQSCEDLFEGLSPQGPTNAQQIVDETSGEVYTIEVNPRFSSTACLTVAAGVNELDLLVRDFCGESVTEPEDFVEGIHLIRYTDECFVTEEKLEAVRQKAGNLGTDEDQPKRES